MNKILLIGSELGKGGAERSLSYLSYFLAKHFDVTLCILSGTDRERFYPTCPKVVFIDPPKASTFWGKAQAWCFRLKAVGKLKEDNGFNTVISFLEGPNYVNVLTRRNEQVILSVRGSKQFDKEISGWFGWLRKKVFIPLLYPRADLVVCASGQLADELNSFFGVPRYRLSFIYNIYDSEFIQVRAAEQLSATEALIFSKPVLIHSGRMHRQKRQDQLIRLLARLRTSCDLRLVLLGDGNLKHFLIQTANEYGLVVCDFCNEGYKPADVYLLGYQANPFKYYAHSQLFILCSGWEGFPNVMAESLICNLPVLAADCPTGPREIFDVAVEEYSPVTRVRRVETGALMPMLDMDNSECVLQWVDEVRHWLNVARPEPVQFSALTNRFSQEDVVRCWIRVIGQVERGSFGRSVITSTCKVCLDEVAIYPKMLQVITNLGHGGAQRVFYDHCHTFANHFQLEEVVFNRYEQPDIYGSRQLRHSLDVGGGGNMFGKIRNLARRSFRLSRLARLRKAELVISHMDGANWVNVLANTSCPKILVVHGTVLRDEQVKGIRQWFRRYFIFPLLYNRGDITVAVSDGIKAELEECGVRNVYSIPNFFDIPKIRLQSEAALPSEYESLLSDYTVLVSSGRFSEQKKQEFLIRVFVEVRKKVPGIKLLLLGDGELRDHLISTAVSLGLLCYSCCGSLQFGSQYDIYFPGYVANPFAYLSRSRLFLFPSGWEGFPMALCEAMICGIPVLSADCPTGPRQILAPGTVNLHYDLKVAEIAPYGILLPMSHQRLALAVWSDAVVAALHNSDLSSELAQAALIRVQDFDKGRVLSQWFTLINGLLGKQSKAHFLKPVPVDF